ncbi:MAG: serine hydrolase domain-containing protein [Blastocatellia bacterium]
MNVVSRKRIAHWLAVLISLHSTACASTLPQSGMEGIWEGQVEVASFGLKKRLILRVSGENGRLRVTLDAPTAHTFDLALRDLRIEGQTLRFSIPVNNRRKWEFDGRLERDSIVGTITGGGHSGVFSLKRSSPGVVVSASRTQPIRWEQKPRDYWPTTEWKLYDPSAQGVNPIWLADAERFIREKLPQVRSLLIVRNGRLFYEQYFQGATVNDLFNIKSVTKSFTSALVGIALGEGLIRSENETIADLLPEYFTMQTDPRKRRITLRHLLTMTAGFEWEENGPITTRWVQSDDYAKFTLDLPVIIEPGKVQKYNSGLSHLLSVSLTRRSRMSAMEYAQKRLFAPIGIKVGRWDTDPQGYNEGSSELFLTARDLARFGFLYLNAGLWESRQIVPAEWIWQSTSPQSGQDPLWAHYGYQWWVSGNDDLHSFAALGYGGQAIRIVPKLDLVVVMTSTTIDPANDAQEFINRLIIPAVSKEQSHAKQDTKR